MARRKSLTNRQVALLKPKDKRYSLPDPDLRGHYVRVTPSGAKSYAAVARGPDGRQVWATIGSTEVLTIEHAREAAREAIRRIKDGLPAFEVPPAPPESFRAVTKSYLKRHVEARGLRSQREIERCLDTYIHPAWGERAFTGIRRRDVANLLDSIEDANGGSQADHVLAVVRGIFNWYATRDDDYVSPIVRGMRRTRPAERTRARILDDDELRLIWRVAEENGTFGAIVRLALLTAQRRSKIATLRWDDVTIDGEWRIRADAREKGTPGVLVLPKMAIAIIREQKRIGRNPYVFAGRGKSKREGHLGPFNGFSPCKRAFDAKLLEALRKAAAERGEGPKAGEAPAPWVIHDLRRTARSLMARAGVRPDIAERVLGHAIPGVEGVYDRHSYRQEKADALERLAALVRTIVEPGPGTVVKMKRRRRSAA